MAELCRRKRPPSGGMRHHGIGAGPAVRLQQAAGRFRGPPPALPGAGGHRHPRPCRPGGRDPLCRGEGPVRRTGRSLACSTACRAGTTPLRLGLEALLEQCPDLAGCIFLPGRPAPAAAGDAGSADHCFLPQTQKETERAIFRLGSPGRTWPGHRCRKSRSVWMRIFSPLCAPCPRARAAAVVLKAHPEQVQIVYAAAAGRTAAMQIRRKLWRSSPPLPDAMMRPLTGERKGTSWHPCQGSCHRR